MEAPAALVLAAVPTALGLVLPTEERGSWISLATTGAAQGALAEMDADLFQENHAPPLTRESAEQFPNKAAELYQGKSVQQQLVNNVALFRNSNVNLFQNK